MTLNTLKLPPKKPRGWRAAVKSWTEDKRVARLWNGDASLWTGSDEADWLGWLNIVAEQSKRLKPIHELREECAELGIERVLLLGMGGSSLAPEVLAETFGATNLQIVDSTDPAQIRTAAAAGDLTKTLVFVSSKSGSTLEPDILRRYFFDAIGDALGRHPGDRFCAVTDPGSDLERVALEDRYRRIFYGVPEIGGRFSALSAFGIAPAGAAGLDVDDLLRRARVMVRSAKTGDVADNPAVQLGLFLGLSAAQGRNKLTILSSPSLRSLGAWLEQLIAESTGKEGKAIIPVDLEPAADDAAVYSEDRVFVTLELVEDEELGDAAEAIADAGRPVISIRLEDRADIAQEFFRWEVATAVAGSVMGINPFNQPDVQASKTVTKQLTDAYEKSGELPAESPFFEGDGFRLYAPPRHAVDLARATRQESLGAYLKAHFAAAGEGDYVGLLAYIERNQDYADALDRVRNALVQKTGLATCLGFGPRFLHSTGQAYKGGPNSGVFLQLTADPAQDLAVPGKRYSFGVVEAAQARGDFQVLEDRGRRALRVHLTGDFDKSFDRFIQAAVRAAS